MTLRPTRVARSFYNPMWKDDAEEDERAFREALVLVEKHRNLDCPAYDRCLNHAACQRWPAFSCGQCPHRTDNLSVLQPKIENPRLRLL